MARKRTGLRNKYRDGRSSYSVKGKVAFADSYGSWSQGKRLRAERVNGHIIGG